MKPEITFMTFLDLLRNGKISGFIKNILICVLKNYQSLMGLEQQVGE